MVLTKTVLGLHLYDQLVSSDWQEGCPVCRPSWSRPLVFWKSCRTYRRHYRLILLAECLPTWPGDAVITA